jgi:hypothetical protein
MYSLSDLRQGLNDPRLFGRELNRMYHTRFNTRDTNPHGVNFFHEDWDNLLILDACRYDVFSEMAPDFDLPGRLEARISKGTSTPEYVRGNLHGRSLRDTVYVTATTMLYREGALNETVDLDLHEIVDVWEDSIDHGEFGIRPETMAQRGLEAIDEYPDKRIVVHFIQPHIPFIGETGREYFEPDQSIWSAKRQGTLGVSDEILWRAYRENLELVLPHVTGLIESMDGRTVVTADHGQMIGDRATPLPMKDYGHPEGLYTEELVKVPWFVNDDGPRRTIREGERGADYGEKRTDEIDEKAREHLSHLGYID